MALSASDIGRLKAAIPIVYRPREVAGALADNFDNAVSLQERERYNLGLKFASGDDQDQAPSFILSGSAASARKAQIDKRTEERRRDERTTVQRALDALNERIALLDAELREIDARLEQIKLRRQQIGDSLEALDEIARRRARGEKLDPNNAADRELMKAAGMTEAEANGADYAAIIALRRRDLDREDADLSTRSDSLLKRRDVVVRERGEVAGAIDDINRADTDEARVLAERRAQTVLGSQQLGEAAFRATRVDSKLVAANAVATAEAANLVSASRNTTIGSSTQTNDFYARSDDLDWDKPSSTSVPPKP